MTNIPKILPTGDLKLSEEITKKMALLGEKNTEKFIAPPKWLFDSCCEIFKDFDASKVEVIIESGDNND